MSSGGIFQLITNDGKQDKLLMATALLQSRLAHATAVRDGANLDDPTPTLLDIEKTHVLFVNAHFKPFAAIGFEYNKVTVAAAALGTELIFSIPLFQLLQHILWIALMSKIEVTKELGENSIHQNCMLVC